MPPELTLPMLFASLQLNGVNVRSATAEQAAYELQKLVETVSILAQYHIASEFWFQLIQVDGGEELLVYR